MRNWRIALMTLAAVLCLCGAARASVGDVAYGPWSEWSDQPIETRTDLFIEKRQVERRITRNVWRYSRYKIQTPDGAGYAAEGEDAARESLEADAPLAAAGVRDGKPVYQGEWFNQQALALHGLRVLATQYRAREIFLTACAISPASITLEVGEHVQLGIKLLDPGDFSLTSGDHQIASIDQQGLLSACSPGRTQITLIYEGQRADCQVLVVGRSASVGEGAVALRLSGTRLTVRYKALRKEVTGLELAAEAEGSAADPAKRLLVSDVDGDSFSMRALCPRIAYLAAPLSDEGVVESGDAKILMLKEILDRHARIEKLAAEKARLQGGGAPTARPEDGSYAAFAGEGGASHRFRAFLTPEGDYILSLQADPSRALTAVRAEAGAKLTFEALDLDNPGQRWSIEPEKADVAGDVWRFPVSENSFCQITDDFKTMARDGDKHDGVDFSPSGDEHVLAVASGRVVRADNRCTHDYKKTKKNRYGRYIDPCDVKDGVVSKYGSYGKYVTIEHEDGTQTMYAHLSKILVKNGQRVKKGQAIGVMGSTGSACGIHLHFEVRVSGRAADPRYFLDLPEIGQYVP